MVFAIYRGVVLPMRTWHPQAHFLRNTSLENVYFMNVIIGVELKTFINIYIFIMPAVLDADFFWFEPQLLQDTSSSMEGVLSEDMLQKVKAQWESEIAFNLLYRLPVNFFVFLNVVLATCHCRGWWPCAPSNFCCGSYIDLVSQKVYHETTFHKICLTW